MLVIKHNLSLQEIVQELRDLSKTKGELQIFVESLPEALETKIGLDHFVYMVRNYPRAIIWITNSEQIFNKFHARNLNVQRFSSQPDKTDRILEEIERLSLSTQNVAINEESNQNSNLSFNLENTFLNPEYSSRRTLNTNPVFDPIFNESPKENRTKTLNWTRNQPVPQLPDLTIATETIFLPAPDKSDIEPIDKPISKSILDQNNNKPIETLQKTSIVKNLDFQISSQSTTKNIAKNDVLPATVQVIQATKIESKSVDLTTIGKNIKSPEIEKVRSKLLASSELLQSINSSSNNLTESPAQNLENNSEKLASLIENQFDHISNLESTSEFKSNVTDVTNDETPTLKNVKKIFWNPLRYLYFLLFSLITVLGTVGIALGFPSVAYTIQFTPEKQENEALFNFEKNQLQTQNFKFNISSKTDTTGTISTTSTRPRAKVRLLNKTGANIELVFSKFYLTANNKRYNPVFDSTQQSTINIPSKNNLSGPIVEIEIESANQTSGENYDLNEADELTPVNLQGVPFGPNFTAVVSQVITSNTNQSSKTVSDGDLRTLRSSIESELLNQKQAKLSEIDSKRYISNINWSTNIESEFNSDHKIGDPSDNVSMTATVSADIYYLDKKIIVDQILAREPKADQVTKIEISNGETAWDKDAQKLKLEVQYIYNVKTEISTDKLKEIAQNSGLNTSDATNKIKKEYPRISDVKTTVSGVPVPINPHIEVEVVQNNEM